MSLGSGQWLGVLGAGQLGRMFCQSAQAMGFRVLVLDPADQAPAIDLADDHLQAGFDDRAALDEMAKRCQAITTEFENVPAASLEHLSRTTTVMPGARAVAIAQNRIQEKAFIAALGVPVAPHAAIKRLEDFEDVDPALFPGILKVAELGYDGKGQCHVTGVQEARAAFEQMGSVPCVLEAKLELVSELSVVLARDRDSHCVVYPVARNIHHQGILAVTHVDGLSNKLTETAQQAACQIAQGLGYHGVLCVEFFVLPGERLVVNEMAPRPHNSGHYTQNACVVSQFEQQARVLANWPLGQTRLQEPAVMLNLLGDQWLTQTSQTPLEPQWAAVLAHPGTSLHLYGKRQARCGRKMGHINITAPRFEQAVEVANAVVDVLGLPVYASLA